MNGIELPEETSFRLLGLNLTRSVDCKPYIHSPLPRLLQGKWAPFLTPESIFYLYKSTIRPFMEYWGGAPRSHGLDLPDGVQKWVVSLVGSGLSAGLQALSPRRDVTSLRLFYKYYYGKFSSELADLVPPKHVTVRSTRRCIVIQLILLYVGLSFINRAFFLARQPFRTPSLMNAFHQITISAFKESVNKFLLLK